MDICTKFSIPYLPQSPDIGQNSDRGISDFRISGQSLIKENCHNSGTSDDIGINLGTVTKLDQRNKKPQKIDDDVILGNFDVTVILPIYGIVNKTYVCINSNLLSYKNWK